MCLSKSCKAWLRKTKLDKYDINLLEKIAANKLGMKKEFYLTAKRKARLNKMTNLIKSTLKESLYPDKEKLTVEETLIIDSLTAEVLDFAECQ